jgi:hypothetical protein
MRAIWKLNRSQCGRNIEHANMLKRECFACMCIFVLRTNGYKVSCARVCV